MEQVRLAKNKDKQEFYKLWQICFGDSDAFCQWFFDNRFLPEYAVCLEVDGEIRSCMQAYPMTFRVRGQLLSGAMLCGVSTHPDYRKKGYMQKIFTFMLSYLRKQGVMAVFHTPSSLWGYAAFGHEPLCDALVFQCKSLPYLPKNQDVYLLPIEAKKLSGAYACYRRFSNEFSGIVDRSFGDFLQKALEYAADGGLCRVFEQNEEIRAYAFYYATRDKLLFAEICGVTQEDESTLLAGIFADYSGYSCKGKLAPDRQLPFSFLELEVVQKGVGGILNVPDMLGILGGLKGYTIGVQDKVITENTGIFDLAGTPCQKEADVVFTASGLLQLFVGYRSLEDIVEDGNATIQKEKGKELDQLFPMLPCYIIDEY